MDREINAATSEIYFEKADVFDENWMFWSGFFWFFRFLTDWSRGPRISAGQPLNTPCASSRKIVTAKAQVIA